jgi:hypothetical protein
LYPTDEEDGAAHDPDGADGPPAPLVREATTHHDADARRGGGGEGEDRELPGREAVLVAQEVVLELAGRGEEQQPEEPGRGEQQESPAVTGQARRSVRAQEPSALGQVVGHSQEERQSDQRDQVDDPPRRFGQVSATGSRATARPAPSAAVMASTLAAYARPPGHLLGSHHPDQQREGRGERPGEALGAAEEPQAGREGAERRRDGAAHRAHREDALAARDGRPSP